MKKIRWFFLAIFGGVGLAMLLVALSAGSLKGNLGDMMVVRRKLMFQGALFAVVGAALFFLLGVGERKRSRLLGYGTRVQGEVTAVERNTLVRFNRQNPWRVKVRVVHPITGEEITVRSHSLLSCAYKAGDKVEVLFDPMNEKKYAVDVQEEEA